MNFNILRLCKRTKVNVFYLILGVATGGQEIWTDWQRLDENDEESIRHEECPAGKSVTNFVSLIRVGSRHITWQSVTSHCITITRLCVVCGIDWNIHKQESIPVGYVPPAFVVRGEGVGYLGLVGVGYLDGRLLYLPDTLPRKGPGARDTLPPSPVNRHTPVETLVFCNFIGGQ